MNCRPIFRSILALGLAATAVQQAACNGSGGPGGFWDVPEVDRQIIMTWLLCTDCIEGELEKVVQRGRKLVPYLSSALVEGPTEADDSLADMRAKEAYLRVLNYRRRRGGVVTQAESLAVVAVQKDAFVLKYRLRAAEALARLDSTRAAGDVAAFCQANPILFERNPTYKVSFQAIGACP